MTTKKIPLKSVARLVNDAIERHNQNNEEVPADLVEVAYFVSFPHEYGLTEDNTDVD